jgi:hypothetical protein
VHSDSGQRVTHLLELEGLDNRNDELHGLILHALVFDTFQSARRRYRHPEQLSRATLLLAAYSTLAPVGLALVSLR